MVLDFIWVYNFSDAFRNSKYIDGQSLKSLRWWISTVTFAIIGLRLIYIFVLCRLGYIHLKEEEGGMSNYSPDLQNLKIDPDFSISLQL